MSVMEGEIIATVAQVLGVGGLGLLVFLILFRDMIRKVAFPRMGTDHAYKIIKIFMYLVFSLAVLGLILGAISRPRPVEEELVVSEASPDPIAEAWLSKLDGEDYVSAWVELNSAQKIATPQSTFVALLEKLRKPRGGVLQRNLEEVNALVSPPGAPKGHYVVRIYRTKFKDESNMFESVTLISTKNGWEVMSYTIRDSKGAI